MRTPRKFFKPQHEGVYLHVCNHTVAMMPYQLPLDNIEKNKFIEIFERYQVKYNIKEVFQKVVDG